MIGVFDSGVGGLSVWREMVARMPGERFVYVADSGHCPYGPKSREEVIERSCRISEYLIARGVDLIVVACNTATAAAIEHLRSRYAVPFVGMEPAVKPAALNTHTGVIGVLATKGTFKGELYLRTLHKFAANATVIEQIGEGLVEAVEAGEFDTPQTHALLERYLRPMIDRQADHVVLGCTHYPFLMGAIRQIVGDRMVLVNPAPAVAKRAQEVLRALHIPKNPENPPSEFITTGYNLRLIAEMIRTIDLVRSQESLYRRFRI